jgi:hypothetical protein
MTVTAADTLSKRSDRCAGRTHSKALNSRLLLDDELSLHDFFPERGRSRLT